jgi:4,5-dihydroxyphthalate decarboxylase
MLERGEIDALVSYQRPQGSRPDAFRRLLADPVAAASDYYRRFGTVPLLHLFAYRTTLRDADPGFPKMVLRALEQSKDVALDRLRDTACYTSSLPFLSATVEQATELMGPDFWPYGLERNRTALSTFLDAAFRQGLTTRRLTLADMFPDFAAS